jgi:rubrerythrin
MEMEDTGCKYYKNLASAATLPGLKTIFTSLAEDEQKHFEIFKSLKAGNQGQSIAGSKALETAQNIFSLLPRDEGGVKGMAGVLDAYKHAMKLEADSYRFYEEAAAKEADAGIKDLLLQIAGEEQKHFNILENIFDFVNAPNEHLAWAEFSNLGEFGSFGRDVDS